MRLKSFIMRYDFCMWNSWCFWIEVRKVESEKVSEQLIDNFFIDFDVILSVAIERCESLSETDREDIFAENIWLRDVAEEIDEADDEIDEQITVDFSKILYVNFDAKSRRSKLLIDFRAWCWRICSWNLLLKLNIWLQRRHVVDFFVDFDLCEANDVFSISHIELTALTERWESLTSWLITFSTSACFWAFCSINSTCFWASCSRWYAWRASCCSILWRSASWHEEDSR